MRQLSHSKYGPQRQLCVLAIGLAVLDFTCFATLTLSAQIKNARESVLSAKSPEARFAPSMVDFSIQ